MLGFRETPNTKDQKPKILNPCRTEFTVSGAYCCFTAPFYSDLVLRVQGLGVSGFGCRGFGFWDEGLSSKKTSRAVSSVKNSEVPGRIVAPLAIFSCEAKKEATRQRTTLWACSAPVATFAAILRSECCTLPEIKLSLKLAHEVW